jgi:large subunit ribosomal protein L31
MIYRSILTDTLPFDNTSPSLYTSRVMKKDLHPNTYRPVVFQDLNNGWSFLTKSTAASEESIKWEDGHEYPLIKVHISSSSHPFFTGQEKLVDIEGRVDKFKAREAAAKAKAEAMKAKASKTRIKTPKADETQKIGSLKSGKK